MHTGAFTLFGCCPYIAAVILDDLLHNRKSDAAAALGGIAGSIRAVEPLKDLLQILLRDSLAVVLDLYPDSIHFVENTDINVPIGLVHIFTLLLIILLMTFFICSGSAMTTVSGDTRFE